MFSLTSEPVSTTVSAPFCFATSYKSYSRHLMTKSAWERDLARITWSRSDYRVGDWLMHVGVAYSVLQTNCKLSTLASKGWNAVLELSTVKGIVLLRFHIPAGLRFHPIEDLDDEICVMYLSIQMSFQTDCRSWWCALLECQTSFLIGWVNLQTSSFHPIKELDDDCRVSVRRKCMKSYQLN